MGGKQPVILGEDLTKNKYTEVPLCYRREVGLEVNMKRTKYVFIFSHWYAG
jgi:hypothetical protein